MSYPDGDLRPPQPIDPRPGELTDLRGLPSCEHGVALRDVCDLCSATTELDAARAALRLIVGATHDRWARKVALAGLRGEGDPDPG